MMQYVRTARAVGWDLSDHYVVLCKVRMLSTWTKRRDEGNGLKGSEVRNLGNTNTDNDMLGVLRGKE